MKVEYVTATEATKKIIWLGRLIMEMRLTQSVIIFYCDSENHLHLATNQVMDSIVKYIDIKQAST